MKQVCAFFCLLIGCFLCPFSLAATNACEDAELKHLIEENCAWQKRLSGQSANCATNAAWLSACAQSPNPEILKSLRDSVRQNTAGLRQTIAEQKRIYHEAAQALDAELTERKEQCADRELVRLLEELPQSVESKALALEYLRFCSKAWGKKLTDDLRFNLKYARFKNAKPPEFTNYLALCNDPELKTAALATVHKLQALKNSGIDWLRLAYIYAKLEGTLMQLDTGRKRDILTSLESIRNAIESMLSFYSSKKALSDE